MKQIISQIYIYLIDVEEEAVRCNLMVMLLLNMWVHDDDKHNEDDVIRTMTIIMMCVTITMCVTVTMLAMWMSAMTSLY